MDPRLPSLEELSRSAEISSGRIPRKLERDYARVMVEYLRQARRLTLANGELRKLFYIGDTQLNDGMAFTNLCKAGEWRGLAFIASENDEEERIAIERQDDQIVCLANRWSALSHLDDYLGEVDTHVDEATVVVIDLDKTAIGARGRNDQVINQARIEAVKETLIALVGEGFSLPDFQVAYDLLNQPEFHPLTEDNQDYLAYICLILSSDLWDLSGLVDGWREGQISSFRHYLELVEGSKGALSVPLQAIHAEVLARTREGDPTPFKDFRRTEYLTTVGRMGALGEGASVERMLSEEILITAEVKQEAERWAGDGALLFGLSDKPDEASVPSREQAEAGYQPIHRTMTHVVGS